MLNNFKENDNKSVIDNILQNNNDYKTLFKVAFKKHQPIIDKAIEHTNFKYDDSRSSHTENVFHNPDNKETITSHTGTNFWSKSWYNDIRSNAAVFMELKKQDKQLKIAQLHLKKLKINKVMLI